MWNEIGIYILIIFLAVTLFAIGKYNLEKNWLSVVGIFCVSLFIAFLSFANNDGVYCENSEPDPVFGGGYGYEHCEEVEKKNNQEQWAFSIKIFLFIFTATSLGILNNNKSKSTIE